MLGRVKGQTAMRADELAAFDAGSSHAASVAQRGTHLEEMEHHAGVVCDPGALPSVCCHYRFIDLLFPSATRIPDGPCGRCACGFSAVRCGLPSARFPVRNRRRCLCDLPSGLATVLGLKP